MQAIDESTGATRSVEQETATKAETQECTLHGEFTNAQPNGCPQCCEEVDRD